MNRRRAFDLLDAGRLANAFALQREDPKVRDRYGPHIFGQTLLLARRLIQAGIPLIQANMGRQADWDFHTANKRRAESLTPPLDRAFSALLDDLAATGLLEDVLVVMTGEFGRTPQMNKDGDGREHWTKAFSAVIAGAGVRGGQVIGRTDRSGSVLRDPCVPTLRHRGHDLHGVGGGPRFGDPRPTRSADPVEPGRSHFFAVLMNVSGAVLDLGIDHERLMHTYNGRRVRHTDVAGQVIEGLLV